MEISICRFTDLLTASIKLLKMLLSVLSPNLIPVYYKLYISAVKRDVEEDAYLWNKPTEPILH